MSQAFTSYAGLDVGRAATSALLKLPKMNPIHFDDCGVFTSPLAT